MYDIQFYDSGFANNPVYLLFHGYALVLRCDATWIQLQLISKSFIEYS